MGSELFRADRRTDMTKVVANFAKTAIIFTHHPLVLLWHEEYGRQIVVTCGFRNFENSFRTLDFGALHFSHPLPYVLYALHI